MMSTTVRVTGLFRPMVSESKTEILCRKGIEEFPFRANTGGQVYKQTSKFLYLGGSICEDRKVDKEMKSRLSRGSGCYRRNGQSMYHRRKVPLRLEVRRCQAEVVETLMYGCTAWNLRSKHYTKLSGAHRQFLTSCTGRKKRTRTNRLLSYTATLFETDCTETIEATVRRSKRISAGCIMRMRDDQILPKHDMLGTLEGGKRYIGGQELECMHCLKGTVSSSKKRTRVGGKRTPRNWMNGTARWRTELQDEGRGCKMEDGVARWRTELNGSWRNGTDKTKSISEVERRRK